MPPVTRSATWLTHELDLYFRATMAMPFAWASNDCCLWAANGVQAMTGVDIADDFRGKYTDQDSAFALIKTITGGETVASAMAWCAAKYGLQEWLGPDGSPRPLMAKRGDLCAIVNGDGSTIAGLVDLSGRYVAAMGDKGILRLPIKSIQRAWHVA